MPMFNSYPSSLSMQTTTVLNTMIEGLPMLEHGIINMPPNGGYFNSTGPCFSQSGVVDNDNNGVLGSVNIGVEGDVFVPPLENYVRNSSTNHNLIRVENMRKKETNNSYFDDINNNILHNNCHNKKSENGVENLFQEQLTMGEWDFEELMKDVSSFPFLDFST